LASGIANSFQQSANRDSRGWPSVTPTDTLGQVRCNPIWPIGGSLGGRKGIKGTRKGSMGGLGGSQGLTGIQRGTGTQRDLRGANGLSPRGASAAVKECYTVKLCSMAGALAPKDAKRRRNFITAETRARPRSHDEPRPPIDASSQCRYATMRQLQPQLLLPDPTHVALRQPRAHAERAQRQHEQAPTPFHSSTLDFATAPSRRPKRPKQPSATSTYKSA
jgi:hypothetical protein